MKRGKITGWAVRKVANAYIWIYTKPLVATRGVGRIYFSRKSENPKTSRKLADSEGWRRKFLFFR